MSLKKELGFWDVFAMASGSMISSGLFILPGLAYRDAGPAVIISYLIASLLMIPTIYSEAELATAMPKAGGDYFFIDRSLGVIGGTVGGIANWFFISLKTSFALVGIGALYELINPNLTIFHIRAIAVSVALVFIIINIVSVKFSGKIEVVLVFWLFLILGLYIFRGREYVEISRFGNFFEKGYTSILATAGLVFISYGGITKITSVAEEVKNPTKNIPKGMFSAFFLVTIIYIVAISITVGVLPPEILANSYAPLSEASKYFLGGFGEFALTTGALLAFITTGNAGIMAASRYPIAMSRDKILPEFFSKVSRRFHTPYMAIISTGVFIVAVISFLDIKTLVKTASTLMLLSFIFVNLSLIVMRESKILSYRPKTKTFMYPYLQIVGMFFYTIIIIEMGLQSILISLVFIFFTLIWYFVYVKKRVSRDSALMYMVKKLTTPDFISSELENELKDILLERDNIVEDRFDALINQSDVVDIEESMDLNEFFKLASEHLSKRMGLDEERVFKKLFAREVESSTMIKEGLAVPHIVINNKKGFDIVVCRAKKGVEFKKGEELVKTIFVLAGGEEERNFHLKALMSIAQIVSESDFEEKWMKAKNVDELKNIILLSNRKRG